MENSSQRLGRSPRENPDPWNEAAELADYLPLSFKTPKDQEYIEFL